jgi:hypothetical protein
MTTFTATVHQNECLPAGGTDVAAVVSVAASGDGGHVLWLRLWTPRGARVAFLRQVAPAIEELTGRGRPVDALTADYPAGAWGDESRDYHLAIRVAARGLGEEMLAARVSLVEAGRVRAQALIRAIWTGDERSREIDPEVARYTELATAGDAGTATARLGRAVRRAGGGEPEVDTSTTARRDPCPGCGAPRSGDDRFCEGCGRDFPTPAAAWEAVARADRGQWERHASAGVAFPDAPPERCFRLEAAQVQIGRGRRRPGERRPEIDLSGAGEDPGVSRRHAVLERRADGSYAVRDLGSTNGTTVNDDPAPVGSDRGVALADGDRIRLGAWTTITLRRH